MSNLADQIRRELDRRDIPRAEWIGVIDGRAQWTYGYGISEVDGQVTVWCNGGRRGFDASARLSARIHQTLTLAGFRTYRDARRDPQQVIVSPSPVRRVSLASRSRLLSGLGIVAALGFLATERPGLLLASGVAIAAAIVVGLLSERHAPRHSRRADA